MPTLNSEKRLRFWPVCPSKIAWKHRQIEVKKKMLYKLSSSRVSRWFFRCLVNSIFFGSSDTLGQIRVQQHRCWYSKIGDRWQPICSRSAHLNAIFEQNELNIAWYALQERDNQYSMNITIFCVQFTNWWSTLCELNRYAVIE